jgi:hypothetical protein
MREDIAKVVFDRPKGARLVRRKRQRPRNMNLSPLEHFPYCRVGRPWDQVRCEVCGAADVRCALGGEIRDHVDCLVETKCWMEGRTVMADADFGPPREVRGFYVHPRSGLLVRPREDR